jgi:hypothetical protein
LLEHKPFGWKLCILPRSIPQPEKASKDKSAGILVVIRGGKDNEGRKDDEERRKIQMKSEYSDEKAVVIITKASTRYDFAEQKGNLRQC